VNFVGSPITATAKATRHFVFFPSLHVTLQLRNQNLRPLLISAENKIASARKEKNIQNIMQKRKASVVTTGATATSSTSEADDEPWKSARPRVPNVRLSGSEWNQLA